MYIRSVTVGVDATRPLRRDEVRRAGRFLRDAAARFAGAGVEVQTVRLVLSPFAELAADSDTAWMFELARDLYAACRDEEIGYASLGPIRWGRLSLEVARAYADALPELIATTESISVSIETAAAGVVHAPAA